MEATRFTMYAGTHTVGGVIFAVSYGRDRVIMEMGAAYDPAKDVADGTVEPRRRNWLADKLRLGSAPGIDGLYSRGDLAGYAGVVPYEETDWNSAVFITHLHLDHMAHMGAVAPSIPVYLHPNAQKLEKALEEIGEGVDHNSRSYTDLEPGRWVSVGQIRVLPVVTSTAGYYEFGFLICTPDGGKIYWTGDMTLHNSFPHLHEQEMELLEKEDLDVLLCDATSFMDSVWDMMYQTHDPAEVQPDIQVPAGMLTTPQFYEKLGEQVKNAAGLCVINYYQREMEDVQHLMEWGKRYGRTLCLEPEAAYLAYKFFGTSPCLYIPDNARYAQGKESVWLSELKENARIVTERDLRENPGGYLLQNSYRHILELFSLPHEGGIYIHAGGTPIGDFDPAYKKLRMLVKKAGFAYMTAFQDHYFGHAYPCQVKYFVDRLHPRVVIPCHSYNPERLVPSRGKQLIPVEGETYCLVPGSGLRKAEK